MESSAEKTNIGEERGEEGGGRERGEVEELNTRQRKSNTRKIKIGQV
jgi:hypothetical protein